MGAIRCDKCESTLTKKDIKSNKCWKCGEAITMVKGWYCTECDRHNPDSLKICVCGHEKLKNSGTILEEHAPTMKSYLALRSVSGLLRFFSWICYIAAALIVLFTLDKFGSSSGFGLAIIGSIPLIVGLIIAGIMNKAIAELIYLFINIANDVNDIKNKK